MQQATQTLDQFAERLTSIRTQFSTIHELVDPARLQARIADLEAEMAADEFWGDQKRAAKVSAEFTRSRRRLDHLAALQRDVDDIATLLEMARDGDESDIAELLTELEGSVEPLEQRLGQLQEESLFTGEYDAGDALVSIQAGEGGVDAQDWAEMLVRMYLRFAERRKLSVEFNHETAGDEAGIRSASFTVHGEYAYGVMNAESGVHRLVRLSPFDSAHRRQTSFAQVEVAPILEDDADVEIDEKDLRVDTYRASGAGGQHINKTESAVRITHMPSGVVVQCQNERSQHQNRDTAMKMLKGKLFELERLRREAEVSAEKGEAQNVGFGSQIRSYVMQPYQMVKDLRTRHETGNVQNVLDGDLDGFIRSFLLHKARGGSSFRVDQADLDD